MQQHKTFTIKEAIEVLQIPTISGKEYLLSDYIFKWCDKHKISYTTDNIGNIYITKGISDYYPCVTAHLDSVQPNHEIYIENNDMLPLYEDGKFIRCTGNQGVGGDNKTGVLAALTLLKKVDVLKVAFFVQEEIGLIGSNDLDKTFFKNIGYLISFDGEGENKVGYQCSNIQLFSRKFYQKYIKDILFKHGFNDFIKEKPTDIINILKVAHVQCILLSGGYVNPHTNDEYVDLNVIKRSIRASIDIIHTLDNKLYRYNGSKEGFSDLFPAVKYESINKMRLLSAEINLMKEMKIKQERIIRSLELECDKRNINSKEIFADVYKELDTYNTMIKSVIENIK